MATFVLEEISANKALPGGGPYRFEWDASHKSIPVSPWNFGVELLTARTDYPGSQYPSEQVLGSRFTEFTLSGSLNDKYNSPGYADLTRVQLETLARRGNPVRISFEGVTVQGLVKAITFDYRRAWDIGYEITFSPHFRVVGDEFGNSRKPGEQANPYGIALELSSHIEELRAKDAVRPVGLIVGTLEADTGSIFDEFDELLGKFNAALSARFIASIDFRPQIFFQYLSSLLYSNAAICKTLYTKYIYAAPGTDLTAPDDAMAQFNYEDWAHGLAIINRRFFLLSILRARELAKRAKPDGTRLYRPTKNESIYQISTQFYGSPHAWRIIADRNGLADFVLEGTELLIIPEISKPV